MIKVKCIRSCILTLRTNDFIRNKHFRIATCHFVETLEHLDIILQFVRIKPKYVVHLISLYKLIKYN